MAEPEAVASMARLDALRASGADRRAPVRFAYLAALARRAAKQPEPVRRLLAAKIAREADELAARSCPPTAVPADKVDSAGPLAELLAYIGEQAAASPMADHAASGARPAPQPEPETRTRPSAELKSVAYFRATWSRLHTERRLAETLAQAPENAGPMNSQHLVLRALQVMRDSSPDYLEGFMAYVDTLIWLEHAAAAKPGERRQERSKKGDG